MSKRFGRNQKRKLKQELAAAKHNEQIAFDVTVGAQRDALYERNRNQRMKYLMEEFVRTFGRNSPFNPDVETHSYKYDMDRIAGVQMQDMPSAPYGAYAEQVVMDTFQHIIMEPVQYGVDVDKLRGMMYVKVQMPGLETVALCAEVYRAGPNAVRYLIQHDLVPCIMQAVEHKLKGMW